MACAPCVVPLIRAGRCPAGGAGQRSGGFGFKCGVGLAGESLSRVHVADLVQRVVFAVMAAVVVGVEVPRDFWTAKAEAQRFELLPEGFGVAGDPEPSSQ